MRRYTQKEMSEILRLAAEPHKDDDVKTGDFTLEEIQRVAGEVGLDPSRVEMAALQLQSRSAKASSGSDWHDSVIIPLANVPSASDWEATVAKLREFVGSVGTIRETADGALEWSGNSDVNSFVAVLHRNPDRPRLTLATDRTATNAVLWTVGLAISLLTGGLTTAILAKNGVTGFEAATLAVLYSALSGGMFGSFKLAASVGRAKTIRLRDHLEQLFQQTGPRSMSAPSTVLPSHSPLLDEPEVLEIRPPTE